MKPSITIDFLRGIVFAYVAYCCYAFGNGLRLGFFPEFQAYQAGAAALLTSACHLILLP